MYEHTIVEIVKKDPLKVCIVPAMELMADDPQNAEGHCGKADIVFIITPEKEVSTLKNKQSLTELYLKTIYKQAHKQIEEERITTKSW